MSKLKDMLSGDTPKGFFPKDFIQELTTEFGEQSEILFSFLIASGNEPYSDWSITLLLPDQRTIEVGGKVNSENDFSLDDWVKTG